MKEFNRKKDWTAVRRGLEAVLDHSSEEYRQLKVMEYKFTGPLFEVGFKDHLQLASLLVCGGLSINTSDDSGYTMLHGAAQGGHLQLVKLLRHNGADINASTYYGYTPFILAAYWGHLEVLQWLAAAGADITARNTHGGNSALEWARERGHNAIVNYLKELLH
ncbi:hypothetical protein PR048_020723 [Dryococelus australis]|uniref:Ankyrin repeat domain-containing protein n=1 Tax=Dryococelus australis TaxID=614101 RepID=A0ABQ9H726_9NEOP|nr:hypothetical protein PR048_020723 [Dryococelus australis]